MNPQAAPTRASWTDPAGWACVLLGLVLGWGLLASTKLLYLAQGQVATWATWLPVGYAFAAGMVAAVNPCGILLLPSLAAFALARSPSSPDSGTRVPRAVALGTASTLGFVLLFGTVGLAVGLGGRALARWFPYGGLSVGIALAVLGTWLSLSGRELGVPAAGRLWERAGSGRGLLSYFGFGLAYGAASLACTLPVFLAVVGTSLAAGSFLAALGSFLGYALGMGTVLTAALVAVTLFESTAMRWVRAVVPYVHRLAAAFLVAAGVFTAGYWWRVL
jgi:cytochrome c biogenesis protein CcdA